MYMFVWGGGPCESYIMQGAAQTITRILKLKRSSAPATGYLHRR